MSEFKDEDDQEDVSHQKSFLTIVYKDIQKGFYKLKFTQKLDIHKTQST